MVTVQFSSIFESDVLSFLSSLTHTLSSSEDDDDDDDDR